MNNPHSAHRTGKYAHAVFHPIKFWAVGNEPDLLINPGTKKPFTVAKYISDFIQCSLAMHQSDPTIQVFGPEFSYMVQVQARPMLMGSYGWKASKPVVDDSCSCYY